MRHVDEITWKRSLLASYGVETKKDGSFQYLRRSQTKGRRHVAPLDFLILRDGTKVSPADADEGRKDGDDGEDESEGVNGEANVFEESNIRALMERIELWESVVRNRPAGRSTQQSKS